ncbi:MAG TPA: hypothetical protein PKO15_09530 [Fibrobacteria bacterium]|nr:hypothetical protein [Fibrobacteria bacterium]HOX50441.1 hypothetical protein [Fibrobacteria bacterium]
MKTIGHAFLFLAIASLAGCGVRAERDNLRNCGFAPVSLRALPPQGDTLRFSVGMEIANPTSQAVALDSFRLVAATGSPLAVLTHGSTRKVVPGGKDTVDLQVAITQSAIASSALQLVFSPPDSISIEGDAWVPGILWGWNRHPIRTRLALAPHLGKLRELLGKGMKP